MRRTLVGRWPGREYEEINPCRLLALHTVLLAIKDLRSRQPRVKKEAQLWLASDEGQAILDLFGFKRFYEIQ